MQQGLTVNHTEFSLSSLKVRPEPALILNYLDYDGQEQPLTCQIILLSLYFFIITKQNISSHQMKYHYLHVHDQVKVVSRPQTPIFSVGTAVHKSKISMFL